MGIEVRNITKTFGTFTALRDVSLSVATGELVALLGPSGSGKTTLLRIIAGLEESDEGSGAILFHDEDVAGRNVGSRQVGFVFQHYALFRHMSVFENVAFGLRVRPRKLRPARNLVKYKVMRLLKLVQLESMANRYPHQLSGGQRQRVALARALAISFLTKGAPALRVNSSSWMASAASRPRTRSTTSRALRGLIRWNLALARLIIR